MSVSEKDLGSIERDMEQTRERLGATIDQLVHRSSPKTILKREVTTIRGYFVDADGKPRQDNIIKVVGGVLGTVTFLVVVRRVLH